jgi:hypothetical protein
MSGARLLGGHEGQRVQGIEPSCMPVARHSMRASVSSRPCVTLEDR